MTYLQRLQQSTESKNSVKAEMNSREAQLQLTKDTLDAEKRNLAAQQKLEILKGQFPLNSSAILEAMYEAETAQQNFNDLMSLNIELFPSNISAKETQESPKRAVSNLKPKAVKKTTARRK